MRRPISPYTSFSRSLDGAKELYLMYVELRAYRGLGARGRLDVDNEDLLWMPRSSVVMSLSALDTYVHALLEDKIPVVLRSGKISDELAKSLSSVLPIKDAKSFREAIPLLNSADPVKDLTEKLKENTLAFLSYQAPEKVINGFELIGHPLIFRSISELWQGPKTSEDDIKRTLANYVKRRNQIAHEGDIDGLKNSRPISPKYAKECHDFIEGLVHRMDRIIYPRPY